MRSVQRLLPCAIAMAPIAKWGDNGAWLGFPLALGSMIFILVKVEVA